jgi:hypothetical protein
MKADHLRLAGALCRNRRAEPRDARDRTRKARGCKQQFAIHLRSSSLYKRDKARTHGGANGLFCEQATAKKGLPAQAAATGAHKKFHIALPQFGHSGKQTPAHGQGDRGKLIGEPVQPRSDNRAGLPFSGYELAPLEETELTVRMFVKLYQYVTIA